MANTFSYNYKPMDYKTAQKQVSGQVDPLFNRAIQGINQQKYQSDVQAGQVAAARGLGHSGLAADQLNKIAIGAQGQIGDLNAQRASQLAQMSNDLMWRDKEFGMQDRAQKYNEFNSDRGYNYQVGRDKVGDSQWDKTYNRGVYESNRNYKRGAYESDRSYKRGAYESDRNYKRGAYESDRENTWRKYTYNTMSASDKANLDWNKKQYGEDAAWRMYEMKYNGEIAKEGF
ncbi:hypothetical protein QF028_004368 [Neobacillus sp. B4I6]|uniref:hypothetical protein n=1 Tax=Neobacillus sp. B4I6 TaxID=3373925 RepID=UPI003D2429AD